MEGQYKQGRTNHLAECLYIDPLSFHSWPILGRHFQRFPEAERSLRTDVIRHVAAQARYGSHRLRATPRQTLLYPFRGIETLKIGEFRELLTPLPFGHHAVNV